MGATPTSLCNGTIQNSSAMASTFDYAGVFDEEEAICRFCGCSDSRACVDGCYWIEVDYEIGTGVCSSRECRERLEAEQNST